MNPSVNFAVFAKFGLMCRFFQELITGEGLRLATDRLNEKNFYAFNPSFDGKKFKPMVK